MQAQIDGFFAVQPKGDCPHCTPDNVAVLAELSEKHINDPCFECNYSGENWICLKPGCGTVACSRYVKSHMAQSHHQSHPDHPIVLSFADFSFWCYECDSYIVHKLLNHQSCFYKQKFPEELDIQTSLEVMRDSKFKDGEEVKLEEQFSKLAVQDDKYSYDQLVQGLKAGQYKKIMVMTGAGISVSAGIPDFRTPGTGLYDNLAEYNLPYPEAIFELAYFVNKPEPVYKFLQHFDLSMYDATPTHYFIKLLHDKGILLKNLTQNIDNLEEKTGIDMSMVCQAHGANRGATCGGCHKPQDKDQLVAAIKEGKVMYCSDQACGKPVKPDVTFFGEALPADFHLSMQKAEECDLLLVMGTALAVSPFNLTVQCVPQTVPKVLFNMNNTKTTSPYDFDKPSENKIFVAGKCDETIWQLVKDLGWEAEFNAVLPQKHKQ